MACHERPPDFKVQFNGFVDDLRVCTLDEIARFERLNEAKQEQCGTGMPRHFNPNQVRDVREKFESMLETLRDVTVSEVGKLQRLLEASRPVVPQNAQPLEERGDLNLQHPVAAKDDTGVQQIVELEKQIVDALERTVETELLSLNDCSGQRLACDVSTQFAASEVTQEPRGSASTASLGSVNSNAAQHVFEETMNAPGHAQETIPAPAPPQCSTRCVRTPRPPATVPNGRSPHSQQSARHVRRPQSARQARRAQGAGMPLPAKRCVDLAFGPGDDLVASMERLRTFLEHDENGGLTATFRRMNVSRTGKLTCREASSGLEKLGVPRGMASAIFRRLAQLAKCPDKQGVLTHDDWLIAFAKVGTTARTEAAVSAVAQLHAKSKARAFTPPRRPNIPDAPSPFSRTM